MRVKPRGFQKIVEVTGASQLILPPNPQRESCIISNCEEGSYLFLSLGTAAAIGSGIIIPPSFQPIEITRDHYGNAAGLGMFAIAQLLAGPNRPTRQFSAAGSALSGAALGVQLSQAVSAGNTGKLVSATIVMTAGAPTVALQLVRGAATINLFSTTVSAQFSAAVDLIASDTIQWNVTGIVAASTFDATISIDQAVTTPSAPTSATVGIWEFEDCGAPL